MLLYDLFKIFILLKFIGFLLVLFDKEKFDIKSLFSELFKLRLKSEKDENLVDILLFLCN